MKGKPTSPRWPGADVQRQEDCPFLRSDISPRRVSNPGQFPPGKIGGFRTAGVYHNEPETRRALDLIFSDHFSPGEPGIFAPIRDTLLTHGDYYTHLADLTSYAQAQARVAALYTDPDAWARKAIVNVACSGKFSSDRTIAEYAADIWHAEPCPVS
jgi:hypothetical protein